MSGYRFCRTDDVPLLVDACNRCYGIHFRDERPMTVSVFKTQTRELDLWASSCMVALSGDEPIGVMLSAKRETASLILRIGVRGEHQRQGHGRHLLSSLARKLSILGPSRLTVEISARNAGVRRFFEACGYEEEIRYADFLRDAPPPAAAAADITGAIVPVSVGDVVESGAFDETTPRSWERSLPTLESRAGQLEGLAIVSDVRIEAFLFHRASPTHDGREIAAIESAPGDPGDALLGILVRHLCRTSAGPVSLPRVSAGEIDFSVLESWGFRCSEEYLGYAATAEE